ncbi:MAG: diadenylate cyclase CdaA [Clostridia bacterium]|nr:diadenylate cyclase CdaA [Clostridia bacterium]
MNTLVSVLLGGNPNFLSEFGSFLIDSFKEFSVKDAIDISLLSVFLFFAFRFIRGRKAGVLLFGAAIFILVMGFALYFEFEATSFLFSQIFKVGAIAIVVIFQPEIRDALEKIGSGSLAGILSFSDTKKKRQLYVSAIDNICKAITDLSNTKTGALIVISRTTKIDDIIQTGIVINADVNSFLLRNLFFNKAPLHDGAVIIDEARIVAAGCLLPLTRRTDVDGDLGTRHRAAIGMSESSDAIVIIVSEETGVISVAYDCSLTRDYTPETLRKFLMSKIVGINDSKD